MRHFTLLLAALLALPAAAATPWDAAKKAVGKATTGKVEAEVNRRLLAESRANQCSFRVDSDELAPGCDRKAEKLRNAVVDARKRLGAAGLKSFRFEVSGHTDSTGDAGHNRALSEKRAAAIKRELVKRGIPEGEITAVGLGSQRMLVKPDDTPKKKARNRRYEIQVRL
jgi:outer membrane protein OmpA-like peptidoglycan-associated protein